jgi:hypothetical protein
VATLELVCGLSLPWGTLERGWYIAAYIPDSVINNTSGTLVGRVSVTSTYTVINNRPVSRLLRTTLPVERRVEASR